MAGSDTPDAGEALELCGKVGDKCGYIKGAVIGPVPSIASENDPVRMSCLWRAC